ncbi:hypothetical protein M0804_015148 [Polistes exclamans]|nr:hypothetical protein M0804_015148 [Polistes exclamans]
MANDTYNTKLYLKVIQLEEENATLREKMAKLDDRNLILERQQNYFKHQFERIHENYSELQREYDEQKDILDEVRRKEKGASIALKKSLQGQQRLLKRLETAELEVLQIANLKDKLKEVTDERVECMKMNAEKTFRVQVVAYIDCKLEKMLRENNQQLEEENMELKLLRSIDTRTSIDQGIANMCSWNDTISRELEKEIQWYELEIHKLIQLTESVFQQLVFAQNKKCVNFKQNEIESSEKINNLEILRQRIKILLDAVNAKPLETVLETDIQIQIQNSGTRTKVCYLCTLNSNEDHVEYFLLLKKKVLSSRSLNVIMPLPATDINSISISINSANNESEKKIVPTSFNRGNQMSDSKENFHELQDLQNGTECRKNLVNKIKRKSKRVCKFYRFNLTKSNIRNDKVIGEETELR